MPELKAGFIHTIFIITYMSIKYIFSYIKEALEKNENVERVKRCHRNDLESVINFMFAYGFRLLITGSTSNSKFLYTKIQC